MRKSGLFGAILGTSRGTAQKAERASLDLLTISPEAEALKSLFHIYETLAERAVGFDQIDRSLTSCGWREIESGDLVHQFSDYSAFARCSRKERMHRYSSDEYYEHIRLAIEKEREKEKSFLKESSHSGAISQRFYSNKIVPDSFVRFTSTDDGPLRFVSQMDTTLKFQHRKMILDFSSTRAIAKYFVDYRRCTWKADEPVLRSAIIAGSKYYAGRDEMETWFVANILSEEFRLSDRWKDLILPEAFMSITRHEFRS